ncbi:MAG: hypothetical protein R3Y63_15510 [Eubacteriales bacterium]
MKKGRFFVKYPDFIGGVCYHNSIFDMCEVNRMNFIMNVYVLFRIFIIIMWISAIIGICLILLVRHFVKKYEPELPQATNKHQSGLILIGLTRILVPLCTALVIEVFFVGTSDFGNIIAGIQFPAMWLLSQLFSICCIIKFAPLKTRKQMNTLCIHCIIATIPEVYGLTVILPMLFLIEPLFWR